MDRSPPKEAPHNGASGLIESNWLSASVPAETVPIGFCDRLLADFQVSFQPWRHSPTVVFSVKATNTQRVRFVLTPTGTGTGSYGELLGEDRSPADGFTLVWRYPSQGLSAHLGIQAIGPGGTAGKTFGIAH
jgi:hypothetical protein